MWEKVRGDKINKSGIIIYKYEIRLMNKLERCIKNFTTIAFWSAN